MNLRRAAIFGVLLCTTLIGLFDHDLWEPDEPRAAELGRAFLDGGSWAVPLLNGEPFMEKPPLVYWTIAASLKVFGLHDGAARLPGLLFAWGTLLFTGLLARRMYGRETAEAAVLVLATSYGFLAATHHIESDAGLLFFVVATVYFLWRARDESSWWHGAAALAALGAFFSKGFIGLVFPGLLFFASLRHPRELLRARPWLWLPLIALPIAGWFALLASDPRDHLLRTFLVDNHLQRFLGVKGEVDRGHDKPPWFYPLRLPLMFLPWTLAPAAAARWIWSRRREPAERYLLIWFATGFLFLSIAGTKRAIYVVPLLPPLALLTAAWIATLPKRSWLEPAAVVLTLAMAVAWFSLAPTYDEKLSYKPFCRELAARVPASAGLYAFDVDETARAVVPFYAGRRFIPLDREEQVAALAAKVGRDSKVFVLTVDVRGKDWHSRVLRTSFPHLWLAMPEGRDRRMSVYSNVPRR